MQAGHLEVPKQGLMLFRREQSKVSLGLQLSQPSKGFRRPVLLGKEMWRRAARDGQRYGKVGRVVSLKPLEHFVGHNGAHRMREPDSACGIGKGEHLVQHLFHHLVEVSPALPADQPNVASLHGCEFLPCCSTVGVRRAKLRQEHDQAPQWRVLCHWAQVDQHIRRRRLCPRPRSVWWVEVIAYPRTFRVAHEICGSSERIWKWRVFARGPRSGADHRVHGIPFALVLIEPLL
mmetsp:Transcript_77525/g.179704  ORF Transcript_77525/g.179704 Transcript_77525/m.179704 type:complete len:233 (-) Transcript_77525:173-871(-)